MLPTSVYGNKIVVGYEEDANDYQKVEEHECSKALEIISF
jgi:hypothetical protein